MKIIISTLGNRMQNSLEFYGWNLSWYIHQTVSIFSSPPISLCLFTSVSKLRCFSVYCLELFSITTWSLLYSRNNGALPGKARQSSFLKWITLKFTHRPKSDLAWQGFCYFSIYIFHIWRSIQNSNYISLRWRFF